MFIKTFCLGAPNAAADADAEAALAAAARRARATVKGLREVQVYRVLRHIPTDSVPDDRSHTGVVAAADRIARVVECRFDDAQAEAAARTAQAWQALLQALPAAGEPLFALDTQSNVPIPPVRQAVQGGFRRWMLLARKAPTHEQFRDGLVRPPCQPGAATAASRWLSAEPGGRPLRRRRQRSGLRGACPSMAWPSCALPTSRR